MLFRHFIFFVFASYTIASNVEEKRDATTTSTINMSKLLSQISVFTERYTVASTTYAIPYVTAGGNLLQPPPSLVGAIITGVPASVLAELAVPSLRSSIASAFKAGNTPQWYVSLPTDVKSYIRSLQTQIAGGGVDLSATPSPFSFPVQTTTTGTAVSGKVASSTSKAGAAQATSALGLSAGVALGIMGIIIAL